MMLKFLGQLRLIVMCPSSFFVKCGRPTILFKYSSRHKNKCPLSYFHLGITYTFIYFTLRQKERESRSIVEWVNKTNLVLERRLGNQRSRNVEYLPNYSDKDFKCQERYCPLSIFVNKLKRELKKKLKCPFSERVNWNLVWPVVAIAVSHLNMHMYGAFDTLLNGIPMTQPSLPGCKRK